MPQQHLKTLSMTSCISCALDFFPSSKPPANSLLHGNTWGLGINNFDFWKLIHELMSYRWKWRQRQPSCKNGGWNYSLELGCTTRIPDIRPVLLTLLSGLVIEAITNKHVDSSSQEKKHLSSAENHPQNGLCGCVIYTNPRAENRICLDRQAEKSSILFSSSSSLQ